MARPCFKSLRPRQPRLLLDCVTSPRCAVRPEGALDDRVAPPRSSLSSSRRRSTARGHSATSQLARLLLSHCCTAGACVVEGSACGPMALDFLLVGPPLRCQQGGGMPHSMPTLKAMDPSAALSSRRGSIEGCGLKNTPGQLSHLLSRFQNRLPITFNLSGHPFKRSKPPRIRTDPMRCSSPGECTPGTSACSCRSAPLAQVLARAVPGDAQHS